MPQNSKIYISSKEVALDYHHLYLVYDTDGDTNTINDQRIIRGGFQSGNQNYTSIVLEVDVKIEDSLDRYDLFTPADRGTVEIALNGASADTVWNSMVLHAQSLGTVITNALYITGAAYDTGIAYDFSPIINSTGFNSNATIASILSSYMSCSRKTFRSFHA